MVNSVSKYNRTQNRVLVDSKDERGAGSSASGSGNSASRSTSGARSGSRTRATSRGEGDAVRGRNRASSSSEGRGERSGRAARNGDGRGSRTERAERGGRGSRTERAERTGRGNRTERAERSGRGAASTRRSQAGGRSSRNQAERSSRTPQGAPLAQNEILRNRIIAGAVVVVLIIVLFNLVTCVAGGIGGSNSGQSAASGTASQAVAPAASAAASATAEASTSAAVATTEASPADSASAASAEAASADASSASSADAASASSSASTGIVAMAAERAARVMQQRNAPEVPADTGVEDKWVSGGRFTTGDAELDQIVKGFCDDNSKEGLSAADNAFNVYCQAMWAEYIERDDNQHPVGPDWDITYAKQIMTEGGGNCYEQVAIGEFILKYFGYYDATAEPCYILRQSGEYGDHGLLYVTDMNGRKCLCDPAFGANGWMLDADIYTVKVVDIGQDPAEFKIANFEEVVKAPWLEG